MVGQKSIVLIDSIARGVPINAITLYKTEKGGAPLYEVIDGKQRLTAIIHYKDGLLTPLATAIKDDLEEEASEGNELASQIIGTNWNDLAPGPRAKFFKYELPVYLVQGDRASAVKAFRRMNEDAYSLNPQEIRNAVFKDSRLLKETRALGQKDRRLDDFGAFLRRLATDDGNSLEANARPAIHLGTPLSRITRPSRGSPHARRPSQ